MKSNIYRIIGLIGATAWTLTLIKNPSFPTPDKILILLVCIFMIFKQGWTLFKRLAPFIVLLYVYESFRGLVPSLNANVDYMFLPNADKFLFFGTLPTVWLQSLLWHGNVQWYDFVFYFAYLMHFVLPIALALLIWKYSDKHYWTYIMTFLVLSFSGFILYLAFPAAPPWMSSDLGLIEPIHRVSSDVWWAMGLKDFHTFYNNVSPNPVAAMPSLHAAYATLIFIFVYKIFGKKWSVLAAAYPFLIFVGTVYQGEHYVIDVLAGIMFAVGAYVLTPVLIGKIKPIIKRLSNDSQIM